MLTAERLRELLRYDSETGLFYWRFGNGCAVKAGQLAGFVHHTGYRIIRIKDRGYAAHRLAWLYMTGEWPPIEIDHINGSRADNRWCNLRLANESENRANSRLQKNNTSGFKGVTFHKQTKKWVAQIGGTNAKRIGYFTTPEEAHKAYMVEARKRYGDFARAR